MSIKTQLRGCRVLVSKAMVTVAIDIDDVPPYSVNLSKKLVKKVHPEDFEKSYSGAEELKYREELSKIGTSLKNVVTIVDHVLAIA